MPPAPTAPTGPTVKLADSDKNRLRTFPSLMSTPYEKELLKWHATGQAALIDVQKGTIRKVGQPAMIRAIDFAPDAKHARVTRMVEPFSYDVPVSSFGSIEEIWDLEGKVLAKVTERPINLGVQDDTQPQTPPDPGGGRRARRQSEPDRQARARVAHGRPGHHLPRAGAGAAGRQPAARGNRAGARASGRRSRRRAGRHRRAAAAAQQAQRKDRLYQWLAAVRRRAARRCCTRTTRA